ncbi:MAG TPA: STAS domain-containing protein [Candidatus Baltobacteraceae bacterium]|jgi:anti-anti-sigma regulatory factor|nr:STAS domain-containing protein [Candidatus Baltobacteraceae bacterium]
MKYTTIVYDREGGVQLEAATLKALGDGRNVIVNLDQLPALEIEDMRRLIKLLRQSRDIGSEFALRATRPDVRKALAVTALDRVFTVLDAA